MNVHYDQKNGIGSVPDNQIVNYKGFKCWMTPDMFLRLARKIYIDPQDTTYMFLKNAIRHGKPIGSPFLNVSWDASKQLWSVWDHEGRHRVQAIKDLWPTEQLEVHIFPGDGLRSKDITPQMIQSFTEGIMAQDQTFVKNPTSKVELKGQMISPQQSSSPPIFETQLQKSQKEAKGYDGKVGVRKNYEYFGTVKKDHLTGKTQWIREVSDDYVKKKLGTTHDKLYQQFNKILQKEKPCQFDDQGNCAGSRARYVPSKTVCCSGCPHHGKKGCTTQALGCKSWACGHMYPNLSPKAQKQWDKLTNKASQSGLVGIRTTKEQEIEIALRYIKNKILNRRRKRWIINYVKNHPETSELEAYNIFNDNERNLNRQNYE